jgi:hypothetical protein
MKLLIIILVLLFAMPIFGAAYTSAISGNWSVNATWGNGPIPPGQYPQAGDTATVQAGHTITIDGNTAFGTSGAPAVCELDIDGTVLWPTTPGASWKMSASGTICINATGIFQIATDLIHFECAETVEIEFQNLAQAYHIKLTANGAQFLAYGCEDYWTTGPWYGQRARLSSCAPACTAGAGRTLTFDRAVGWATATDPDFHGFVLGVGGGPFAAGANDPELITGWTNVSSTSISNVALAQGHQVGDIAFSVSRNVLIHSTSSTNHGKIGAVALCEDAFDVQWIRLNEMGVGTTGDDCAIGSDGTNNTFGTIEYTAVTNAENGSNTCCFGLRSDGFTSFTNNSCFDVANGYALDLYHTAYTAIDKVDQFSAANTGDTGSGIRAGSVYDGSIGEPWISNFDYGIWGAITTVDSAIVHQSDVTGIHMLGWGSWFTKKKQTIKDSEIRHSDGLGAYTTSQFFIFDNNDVDNTATSCVELSTTSAERAGEWFLTSNTYDGCNTSNAATSSGVYVSKLNGFLYMTEEAFGVASANNKSNIQLASHAVGVSTYFKGTCNECTMTAAANPHAGWAWPIYIYNGINGYQFVTMFGPQSYMMLHNTDGTADDHQGWGPLGSWIEKVTLPVVNGNLALKIEPGSAVEHAMVPIGQIFVASGDVLSVSVQLRKNQSQVAAYLPKLALSGCGFWMEDDFDTMADVNNTWDTLTVSGTTNAKGAVHVYVLVRNNRPAVPVNEYTPQWPPTLDIYADALTYTKS